MNTLLPSPGYRSQAMAFQHLMQLWQPCPGTDDAPDYQALIQANPVLEWVLSQSPCLTWVLDTRSRQYPFVSSNVARLLGYPAEPFRERGLAFLRERIHPDDLPRLDQLCGIGEESRLSTFGRPDRTFSRDYRFRRADNTFVRLFEQNTILQTNRWGHVTHLLGVVSDVTSRSIEVPRQRPRLKHPRS